MSEEIRPLRDFVLVQRMPADERTAGGLYIPDSAKKRPDRGRVLAVGPGRVTDEGRRIEPHVKVGDVVVWPEYYTFEFGCLGDDRVLIRAEHLDGVVED